MKRKILSLILVFAMTVSLLTVGTGAVEPTYGDTAGHWAESSIERWSAYGIIQGSNGQFDPNGQLTCAQLATILAKLLKLPAAKDAGFTDNTADAWYYDAINRCAAAGILNGNGDGTVTPEAPITRERAMVMLARALGIEPIRKPDLTKYTDAAQVSAYAQGYVAALIEAGIVGGVTADELAPQANINRASTVTILDRAISTYADKAGATVKADGKGLVLVVAENVKITGAPEGTKIVVADGATGLTVNGKSVSDDQTYIVPKTEPAKPSGGSSSGGSYTPPHSHSYDTSKWVFDDTKHWHASTCGHNLKIDEAEHTYNDSNVCTVCGQVNPTETVAKIGAKNYATLADAMTYAVAGDTIVLKTDIPEAEQVTVGKKVTLDMDSHTITSAVKQVFTVLDSGDLTITGNGTITGPTGDAAKNFDSYSMIYVTGTNAKLTVLNGTITAGGVGSDGMYGIYVADGGNVILGDADTKAGPTITTWFAAVGENNTTSPANITIYGGEYTAQAVPADSDWWAYFCAPVYASASGNITISGGTFNGYYGISSRYVNVGQNLNISGGTFNGSKSALFVDTKTGTACNEMRTIAITGGTFSSDPTAYVADGYEVTGLEDGKYQVVALFAGGTGTAEDPFVIQNAEQLKAFRDKVNAGNTFEGKTIELMADITVSDWTPIGQKGGTKFNGTFDGNGKSVTINGISTELNTAFDGCVGFFGAVENATVKNLTVEGNVSGKNAAGIVARVFSGATIENCVNKANVTATSKAGGIVSYAQGDNSSQYGALSSDCTITNCKNYGEVITTGDAAGGIYGWSSDKSGNLKIIGCENSGAVTATGEKAAGGIVGQCRVITVENCTNNGNISSSKNAGGIIGANDTAAATIIDCHNTGTMTGAENKIGGIAGAVIGTIKNCTTTETDVLVGTFGTTGLANTNTIELSESTSIKVSAFEGNISLKNVTIDSLTDYIGTGVRQITLDNSTITTLTMTGSAALTNHRTVLTRSENDSSTIGSIVVNGQCKDATSFIYIYLNGVCDSVTNNMTRNDNAQIGANVCTFTTGNGTGENEGGTGKTQIVYGNPSNAEGGAR